MFCYSGTRRTYASSALTRLAGTAVRKDSRALLYGKWIMKLSASRKKASLYTSHKVRLGVLLVIALAVGGQEIMSRSDNSAHGLYRNSVKCTLTAADFTETDRALMRVPHSTQSQCTRS